MNENDLRPPIPICDRHRREQEARKNDTTTCRWCAFDAEEARKLRRRYATAALMGLRQEIFDPEWDKEEQRLLAARAFAIADEMLKVDDGRWIK